MHDPSSPPPLPPPFHRRAPAALPRRYCVLHAAALVVHEGTDTPGPIRSSIFVGAEAALPRRTTSVESRGGEEAADDDDEAAPPPSIQRTSLVASGSTDGHLYIYDVGGHAAHGGTLTQRLEGHSDRVYATSFHPHEPILASCSADFTLKIWVPQTGAAATIAAGRPGPSREPSVRSGNAFGGNGRGAVQ